MPSQRLKGQEVNILMTAGGELVDSLGNIQSFEFEDELEILKEGYLGEFANRYDEVYMGVNGKFDIHISRKSYFDFRRKIKDRAQRKTPDVQFNISCVVSFPSGETKTVLFADVVFGTLPHSFPGRKDYAKISMAFGTSDSVESD